MNCTMFGLLLCNTVNNPPLAVVPVFSRYPLVCFVSLCSASSSSDYPDLFHLSLVCLHYPSHSRFSYVFINLISWYNPYKCMFSPVCPDLFGGFFHCQFSLLVYLWTVHILDCEHWSFVFYAPVELTCNLSLYT